MARAYELLAEQGDWPLHLGVTEAGPAFQGTIKSATAFGYLLGQGIGDTIRVSLSAPPVEEVKVGLQILQSLNLRERKLEIVSCPSCGRAQVDVYTLAEQVTEGLQDLEVPLRVAVMGCVVNGPGEAREADLGVASGNGKGQIFVKGEVIRTVPEDQIVETLIEEANRIAGEMDLGRTAVTRLPPVPRWSPSTDREVRAATGDRVRLLTDADTAALAALSARAPVSNVFVDSLLEAGRLAGPRGERRAPCSSGSTTTPRAPGAACGRLDRLERGAGRRVRGPGRRLDAGRRGGARRGGRRAAPPVRVDLRPGRSRAGRRRGLAAAGHRSRSVRPDQPLLVLGTAGGSTRTRTWCRRSHTTSRASCRPARRCSRRSSASPRSPGARPSTGTGSSG